MIFRLLSLLLLILAAVFLLVLPFRAKTWQKRLTFVLLGAVFATGCFAVSWVQKQRQFDLIRGIHLVQLAQNIEAYHQKTGRWPLLEGAPRVRIQFGRAVPSSPAEERTPAAAELKEVLQQVVGNDAGPLPRDPQKSDWFGPIGYLYEATPEGFLLEAHLFEARACFSEAVCPQGQDCDGKRLRVGTIQGALSVDQVRRCLSIPAEF